MDNNDFIRTRSTFIDKDKKGRDTYSLYLGTQDIQKLVDRLNAVTAATDNGAKVQMFLNEFQGKPSASLLVSPSKAAGGAGAPAAKKRFVAKTIG